MTKQNLFMESNKMKIIGISDLHGYLPNDLPECDVVCCCGDIVPLDYQTDTIKSVSWFILDFVPWVESLNCKKFIFVAGNHDFFLENIACGSNIQELVRSANDVMKRILVGSHKGKHNKLVYLMDNSYEYDGVKFYGTPWIADLSRWAFYKNDEELAQIYDRIPKKCDVLLTHMPPKMGGCGEVIQRGCFNTGADYGSGVLANAILERDIKWSLCGHVHSGRHTPLEYKDGCFAVNCSIKNEDYKAQYYPVEINLQK